MVSAVVVHRSPPTAWFTDWRECRMHVLPMQRAPLHMHILQMQIVYLQGGVLARAVAAPEVAYAARRAGALEKASLVDRALIVPTATRQVR